MNRGLVLGAAQFILNDAEHQFWVDVYQYVDTEDRDASGQRVQHSLDRDRKIHLVSMIRPLEGGLLSNRLINDTVVRLMRR